MFSVQSPLASPALRNATAPSFAFPFHQMATPIPSSLLSRPYSPISHTHSHATRRTPRDSHPTDIRCPLFEGYFDLAAATCSPKFLATSPVATPPILSHGDASLDSLELGIDNITTCNKQSINDDSSAPTGTKSTADAQARRRKPTLELNLPLPSILRKDSFEAAILTGVTFATFTPGTPCQLTWSDSYDSVETLRPVKGRIPTPYPKIDDSEWIEDVDEAIKMI